MSGLAFPKPEKRQPKPRKPIQRSGRPARVRRTPRGKAIHAADLKWAKAIRESGPCAALGVMYGSLAEGYEVTHSVCYTPITAAHIVSRRYASTRTDPRNGMPLCLGIHSFFTAHPKEWEAFVVKKIGQKRLEALKAKAQGRAA